MKNTLKRTCLLGVIALALIVSACVPTATSPYSTPYSTNNQQYDQRKAKHLRNCQINWTQCSNLCNTIAESSRRMLCVSQCNTALNQCQAHRPDMN
ncbi:hypothetical protein [Desulfovibrio inopinatus]|uniref:hypothetical protein n=1 Tax=Desulfovibrio inopinatus TaxID=102109 RepID=UPI0004260407|nr:hypothetical protein [Desulfovibrio inopinatus]